MTPALPPSDAGRQTRHGVAHPLELRWLSGNAVPRSASTTGVNSVPQTARVAFSAGEATTRGVPWQLPPPHEDVSDRQVNMVDPSRRHVFLLAATGPASVPLGRRAHLRLAPPVQPLLVRYDRRAEIHQAFPSCRSSAKTRHVNMGWPKARSWGPNRPREMTRGACASRLSVPSVAYKGVLDRHRGTSDPDRARRAVAGERDARRVLEGGRSVITNGGRDARISDRKREIGAGSANVQRAGYAFGRSVGCKRHHFGR
jgi:hypothetical protein